MSFDYVTNLTAVKTALENHNTTTASPDLSSGLTKRVTTISTSDPEVTSVRNLVLPAVFVRISRGSSEFASLGITGPSGDKKFKNVTYDVIALYHKDGSHTKHEDLLTETYNLARNIEGTFEAEPKLSNTALWVNPESTDFLGPFNGANGVVVKGVLIELNARYFYQ